jgi:hypothetical protein
MSTMATTGKPEVNETRRRNSIHDLRPQLDRIRGLVSVIDVEGDLVTVQDERGDAHTMTTATFRALFS